LLRGHGRFTGAKEVAVTTAVVVEVPLDRLWHVVPAYPAVNEIWLRLLEACGRP
jgi:hypothetical protein